jgi:hypothetical protein
VPTLPPMAIDPAPGTDALPASGSATEPAISAPPVSPSIQGRGERGSSPLATATTPASPPTAGAEVGPATAAPTSRRRTKRIRARQVQRVVTHIDPWSMLRVSLLFALSLWLIVVVAGVLLWRVAVSTGTIGNVENFLAQILAEDTFTINGGQIFQGSLVAGLVFFVTGAVFAVVTSVLFNLIAGVVGGVRFTMVELETARPVDDGTDGA